MKRFIALAIMVIFTTLLSNTANAAKKRNFKYDELDSEYCNKALILIKAKTRIAVCKEGTDVRASLPHLHNVIKGPYSDLHYSALVAISGITHSIGMAYTRHMVPDLIRIARRERSAKHLTQFAEDPRVRKFAIEMAIEELEGKGGIGYLAYFMPADDAQTIALNERLALNDSCPVAALDHCHFTSLYSKEHPHAMPAFKRLLRAHPDKENRRTILWYALYVDRGSNLGNTFLIELIQHDKDGEIRKRAAEAFKGSKDQKVLSAVRKRLETEKYKPAQEAYRKVLSASK